MKKSEPFEKGLDRLEGIVRQLEAGEKGLEESLDLFETGTSLAKDLTSRLEEVKHRVEVLIKQGEGKFKAEPMKAPQGEE
ncbi:MAG: exodeoxyribonuclease VII small subunit [Elusimicrobia bacterium]|nr:exodeoxyribonuclease VII small subunit [Elusimicrobiota bacterium]